MLRDNDGIPKTLFHGVQGSRTLPLDEWVDADDKLVHDGDKRGATQYRSGFHVMLTYDEIVVYSAKFHKINDLVICEVDISGPLRDKTHSPYDVLLANRMRIRSDQWEERIHLTTIRT